MNRVTLLGYVGADSELKFTNSGSPVLKFRMATTERYKDKQGNKQESTEWHTCIIWGKHAEVMHKYLVKGTQVLVEGKLQTRQWEDKNGSKHYSTEINVMSSQLISDNRGSREKEKPQPEQEPEAFGDDDIPF